MSFLLTETTVLITPRSAIVRSKKGEWISVHQVTPLNLVARGGNRREAIVASAWEDVGRTECLSFPLSSGGTDPRAPPTNNASATIC